jgi:midasin
MCWTSDSETKFKLVSDFVEQYPDHFADVRTRLQQLKSSTSRFEWVDSVLVQSVQEGHWAVFENANLCNPSILDRLNGLLEDGAQALTINEQGLIDGHLREVTKHSDFRAIFVITQSSLEELGKDVSKALRNRCLEIKV